MRTIKYMLYTCLFAPLFVNAQNKPVNKVYWAIVNKSDGKDILTKDLVIDISQIEDLKVLTSEQIFKRFPGLNSNVVLFAILKPSADIVKLSEFYSRHKINIEFQKLPISVNKAKVIDVSTAIFDENSIHDVRIDTDSLRITTNLGYKKVKTN